MNQDWASYFCRVDDRPAAMFLNLGLADAAPLPSHPHMGFVSVHILNPDENGFSRREECDTLMALEDALIPALEAGGRAIFSGRCTTDGMRDFIFYLADPAGREERIAAALENFPGYVWTAGSQEEKDWETYFDLLYPDDQGLNAILNDRVRHQLEEHDDDQSVSRPIDHWLYFPVAEDLAAFVREAEREGFSTHPAEGCDPETGKTMTERFAVRLVRADAPKDIDTVTWNLRELADAHGGIYDGWGTGVVREDDGTQ